MEILHSSEATCEEASIASFFLKCVLKITHSLSAIKLRYKQVETGINAPVFLWILGSVTLIPDVSPVMETIVFSI